jgi:hypothetical protein
MIKLNANIGGLRPNYTEKEYAEFISKLENLVPGSSVRFSTIFHEIFWNPEDLGNFKGLDKVLEICRDRQLQPLVLVMPAPHPTSGWYKTIKNRDGWWLPNEELIPKIAEKTDVLVKRVLAKCKEFKLVPTWQLWNEPAGKAFSTVTGHNLGNKPGGSSTSKYGEWTLTLHKLLWEISKVLRNNKIPTSKIMSPAFSCIGDGNIQEVSEVLTWTPPSEYNWQKNCGVIAAHLFFRAGWAQDPKTRTTEVTNGFNASMNYFKYFVANLRLPRSKKIVITEFYVTPGMCGVLTTANPEQLDPFRTIAFDLLAKENITSFVYGIGDENDSPGTYWLAYGGWSQWLKRKNEVITGGFNSSPSTGGFNSSPSTGGFNSSPSTGGFNSSPATGGFNSSPSTGGFNSSPSTGGFNSSR